MAQMGDCGVGCVEREEKRNGSGLNPPLHGGDLGW
jgi:hypothetical protein